MQLLRRRPGVGVWASTFLLFFAVSQWASAGFIYTFTGSSFNSASSPYTTSDNIFITITLDDLLAASFGPDFTTPIDLTSLPGYSLSMSDGVQTITSSDPLDVFASKALVYQTDTDTTPLQWDIVLNYAQAAGDPEQTIDSTNLSGYGQFGSAFGGIGDPFGGSEGGTWTVAEDVQVPNPGSPLLLAIGLLALASLRLRQRRGGYLQTS